MSGIMTHALAFAAGAVGTFSALVAYACCRVSGEASRIEEGVCPTCGKEL